MTEEAKKVSFGFSKLVKKTTILSSKLNQPKPNNDKVEFIDCLEGKSIKLKDPVECKDEPLVIPLKRETLDNSIIKEVSLVKDHLATADSQLGAEHVGTSSLQTRPSDQDTDSIPIKSETLDEIAAREIIEDLNKRKNLEEARVFSVPLTSSAPTGEKESSLDDYENIPVSQFGQAMLRGMGWAPGKGIGKNEKLVTPSMPNLRPKGMGLGADKVIKTAVESEVMDKDLKMAKGSYVRIIAGIHKDCYGQVEGFDEESCRMIVKLSLKNITESLNEFMVQLVSKNEFIKNSKVINVGKYEKYKDDEDYREFNKQSNTNDKNEKGPSRFTDKALSEHIKRRPKEYKDKSFNRRSKSKSVSPEDVHRRKNAPETSKHHPEPFSKNDERRKLTKNSQEGRHSPSESSDSSSDYSSRKKHRTKRKKPSSHRYKSRTRSRSPRDHSSHKKHKKRK